MISSKNVVKIVCFALAIYGGVAYSGPQCDPGVLGCTDQSCGSPGTTYATVKSCYQLNQGTCCYCEKKIYQCSGGGQKVDSTMTPHPGTSCFQNICQ